jgi:DNA-binding YbaB/EbfC family protein
MNMQAMMAQARKLQRDIEKATEEIENSTFNYENENIYVECNGKNELKKITIKNDDIVEDKELLEDVIVVAINNVLEQVKNEKEKKLGKYTNGLGGLF